MAGEYYEGGEWDYSQGHETDWHAEGSTWDADAQAWVGHEYYHDTTATASLEQHGGYYHHDATGQGHDEAGAYHGAEDHAVAYYDTGEHHVAHATGSETEAGGADARVRFAVPAESTVEVEVVVKPKKRKTALEKETDEYRARAAIIKERDEEKEQEKAKEAAALAKKAMEPLPAFPTSLVTQAHPIRRFGQDRTARFAIVARVEMFQEREPLEQLRHLFNILTDYGRSNGWTWTPMQDRAAPLLDKREGRRAGSSLAFSRCFVELALSLGSGFEDDQFRVVNFGGEQSWVSKPYNKAGVDATFKGNILTKEGLTGSALLGKHHFVHALGHIFDPTLGVETPYFGRAEKWRDHIHNVVHAWVDPDPVEPGLLVAKQVDIRKDLASTTYLSFDFSPKEFVRYTKPLTDKTIAFSEMEKEEGKGFLRMAYPNFICPASTDARTYRLADGGWYLWHVHKDAQRQTALRKEIEAERKRVEKERKARIDALKAKRKAEALNQGAAGTLR